MQIEAAEVVVVHGGDLLQLAAAAGLNIVVITAMMSMPMLLCNVVQLLLGDRRTLAFERCQHELWGGERNREKNMERFRKKYIGDLLKYRVRKGFLVLTFKFEYIYKKNSFQI